MKSITLTLAAAALAMMAVSCGGNSENTTSDTIQEDVQIPAVQTPAALPDTVVKITDDAMLRPGQAMPALAVIDFNATWCGPCRRLSAPLREIANKYAGKVVVYSVDYDQHPQTFQAYGVDNNIPVLIFQKPDGSTERYQGLSPWISDDDLKNLDADAATAKITESLTAVIDQSL